MVVRLKIKLKYFSLGIVYSNIIYIFVAYKTVKNNTMTKFEVGKKYEMRFIGDSELKPVFVCVSRTLKIAKFEVKHETLTRKIKVYNNFEYVLEGSYSMSPSIRADKIVN